MNYSKEEFKRLIKENNAEDNKLFLFLEVCESRNIRVDKPFLNLEESKIIAMLFNELDRKYTNDNVDAEIGIFSIPMNQVFRILEGGDLTEEEFERNRMVEHQFKVVDGVTQKTVINNLKHFDINKN